MRILSGMMVGARKSLDKDKLAKISKLARKTLKFPKIEVKFDNYDYLIIIKKQGASKMEMLHNVKMLEKAGFDVLNAHLNKDFIEIVVELD